MDGRLGALALASIALAALAGTAQAAGSTVEGRCTVDVGAPVLLVDQAYGADHTSVGGCVLVDRLGSEAWVSDLSPGDWDRTPFVHDCVLVYDEDGDGTGYERIGLGENVPAGAKIWASCDSGVDLDNRIELTPFDDAS